jgi:hypothetical protein
VTERKEAVPKWEVLTENKAVWVLVLQATIRLEAGSLN